jgi:hypothetical protein
LYKQRFDHRFSDQVLNNTEVQGEAEKVNSNAR